MYKKLVYFLANLVLVMRLIVRIVKRASIQHGPFIYQEWEWFPIVAMLNGYGTWILIFRALQEFIRKIDRTLP